MDVYESALDGLPYKRRDVETPGGHLYRGLELSAKICAVEIVRAGGAMRTSFSRIFVDAPIGKVLIQTSDLGEPRVSSPHYMINNSSTFSNSHRISMLVK